MNFLHTLEMTVQNLACHAFRSILASLGVVLGVGAVIAMLAVSEGARSDSLKRIQTLGVDNIIIRSIRIGPDGKSGDSDGKSGLDSYGITTRDLEHIRLLFENVRHSVPVRHLHKTIYADGRSTDLKLMGTTPEFLDVTRSTIADSRGRWLTDQDSESLALVCVLGTEAAGQLFGATDPLGKSISAGGFSFRVVGVLANRQGAQMDASSPLENIVYIHYATAKALFGNFLMSAESNRLIQVAADYVYVSVNETAQLPDTVARLRAYLGATHDTEDWMLQVPLELLQQQQATQRMFTIVTGAIAGISLLVGGIGIMNIMLANIYERTKEIGTLRALGGKKRTILLNFMLESMALTGCGGVLGLLLGFVIASLIEQYAGMQTTVSPLSVAAALVVSVLTGLIFGSYPAWKAASLNPIEALRR